ncbi:MAG: ferritin-like domain-containing protein [Limisphaerales bacterium]
MKTLEDLFLDELADMYDVEHRLTKALPKMAKAASHEALCDAFEAHLAETQGHIEMLRKVFKAFGREPRGKKCEAIAGLLKEGDEIAADNKGEPTINAALISAAQKVEHYEIASYGCLHEWASLLNNKDAVELLAEILEQEKDADEKLTEIAREACNPQAENEDDDEKPEQEPEKAMQA